MSACDSVSVSVCVCVCVYLGEDRHNHLLVSENERGLAVQVHMGTQHRPHLETQDMTPTGSERGRKRERERGRRESENYANH